VPGISGAGGDAPHRVVANALIAAGALIVAGSGSLAGLGRPEYLFVGELSGIVVIFVGFLCGEQELGFAKTLAGRWFARVPVRAR